MQCIEALGGEEDIKIKGNRINKFPRIQPPKLPRLFCLANLYAYVFINGSVSHIWIIEYVLFYNPLLSSLLPSLL